MHPKDLDDPKKRARYIKQLEKVCFMGGAVEKCAEYRMAKVATNLAGDDGVDIFHPGHSAIIDSGGRVVALIPGEYIEEYLEPKIIHGEVTVRA